MSGLGDRKLNAGGKKRRYQEASTNVADWGSVNEVALRDTIEAVTRTGCAIRFGYSRDGGAYAVGVVGDGDPYTVWAGSAEEVDIKLAALAESFRDG